MPLSLDGFCAHHEGQSHGIDWYCKQCFYIRLIYLNWTIHFHEGKTGSGWTKATPQTKGDNFNQKHFIFLVVFIPDFFFIDNQSIRQVKLGLLWLLKNHYRPEVSVGWGGNIFISSAGLAEGFLGVLGEMRWGYERSCRTAQCDSKSEATPPDGVTWNKRKQGDETQTQTSVGKLLHLRAFCDVWPYYSHKQNEFDKNRCSLNTIMWCLLGLFV